MAKITEAQRKWLEELGVDTAVAEAEPPVATKPASAAPAPAAGDEDEAPAKASGPAKPTPAADEWSPPSPDAPNGPRKPFDLNLLGKDMQEVLRRQMFEQAEIDRKEAEKTLVRMNKVLADVKAYVAAIPGDQISRSSYVAIIKEVRQRFPEAANLSQWVKQAKTISPPVKDLPSPRALMDVVQDTVKKRGAELGWSLSTGKDLGTVSSDRLLAAYMSELPAGVSIDISGGQVKLSLEGAALSVATPAGQVDASADKGGASVSLKNENLAIEVRNEGWKEFDPKLRGEWQKISDAVSTVAKLKADRDKVKAEIEQKKKDGTEIKADLTADFDKKEAEFNLAWKKLQEQVTVTAKATEDKVSASVLYLKKDKNDKVAVKAGVDAEVDLKAMQGKLKAFVQTPTIEAALEVTAAADKVAAKLELTAVKTGTVVTANFEKSLEETKAAIEVMTKDGKTKLAAELKKKAEELTAKIKLVHETKDLKLAAELEKTLKDVRGSIELAYSKGSTTIKGGASGSTSGEVGGKVQIEIALNDGRTFKGGSDKLTFAANVSNKGYKFEVNFSMGEPVETTSLQDLFTDADRQIKELYKLVGNKGVRSIEDVNAINARMQEVMKPVNDAALKAKTVKKSDFKASFGFSIEGDWPAGGKASPPAAMFSVTLSF
jgi:hypothetical protein